MGPKNKRFIFGDDPGFSALGNLNFEHFHLFSHEPLYLQLDCLDPFDPPQVM